MTAIPLGGHGSLRGQPLAENVEAFQCLFGVVGETLLLKGEIPPKPTTCFVMEFFGLLNLDFNFNFIFYVFTCMCTQV